MSDHLCKALWVGPDRHLDDGTVLVAGETVVEIPVAEAEASDHWEADPAFTAVELAASALVAAHTREELDAIAAELDVDTTSSPTKRDVALSIVTARGVDA